MGNQSKNNKVFTAGFLIILIAISGRILYNYKQPDDKQDENNKWLPPAASVYAGQNNHNPIKITELTHNNSYFQMTAEPDLAFNMPFLKFHCNSTKYQPLVLKKKRFGNRIISTYEPANIVEHILQINPLGKDGSSIAPEAKLVIKPFNNEFYWIWNMDFNDKVKTLRITLSEKNNPTNKAQWMVSNLPASVRLAGDSLKMQSKQAIKSIVMEAEGAELKAFPNDSSYLSNTELTGVDGLVTLACKVHVKTPAFRPRESWYLITSHHSAEWTSMVKKLQYQSVTSDPYSYPESITPIKSNSSAVIPIHTGISFSGMQQYLKIDGALVERNEHKEIITLHDADIVFEPLHHSYVLKWKEDQTITTPSGIQIKPLNTRPHMPPVMIMPSAPPGYGGPPPGFGSRLSEDKEKNKRTAMLFVAWYLPKGYNGVRNSYRPPTTSYVTEPTPDIALLPPAKNGGDPEPEMQYNWENVCSPNDTAADVNDRRHMTPGINSLNNTYSLLYYPIALPKEFKPMKPFHLKEYKLIVFISNVKSVNPISFTTPVRRQL